MNNLYKELEARGLINQVTSDNVEELLNEKLTLYCGFDPTADSLHIGHLLPITMLKRFSLAGHKSIALIGGATGLIGDPSFKKNERALNSYDVVSGYVKGIKNQLTKIIGEDVVLVNNYEWVSKINTIDFLRDYGKNFTINYMLNKDCVSSRIESGISFTEFSYMILQALDFYTLNKDYGCRLQLGGSDQWGNITAGLELIRRQGTGEEECFGITIPLVTKSDGTKFGKTEGGAIWLNPEKTSPYEFYQYFINVSDADVIKYLKLFTFIDLEEIQRLEEEVKTAPFKRNAQRVLAEQVTAFVHGQDVLEQVQKVSEALFTGDISNLSLDQIQTYFTDIKQYHLRPDQNIVDALIAVELASSKREAREFLNNKAIKINGKLIEDENYIISPEDLIGGQYMMIKRGKKKIHFVKVG